MPAMSLNHYTIMARDLEATKDFYTDIVGLSVGDRPPLDFPGYWLYCGGVPTVHLVGHRPEVEPINDAASDPAKTGRLDHIAFACEGLKDMKANLEQHKHQVRRARAAAAEHDAAVLLRSGRHRGGVQLPRGGDAGALTDKARSHPGERALPRNWGRR